MIQANELRIGNIVYANLKSGNGRTVIHTITAKDILNIEEEGGYLNFEPIPLTPELLDKCCGFKLRGKDMPCSSNLQNLYWTHSEFPFAIYNLSWTLQYVNAVNIEYLHRLQNLFFFVNGKEIEINIGKL